MAIEDNDIERLKEIFVTRQECQKSTDSFEAKLNKDLVRLAVIETEMKQIKWLTGIGVHSDFSIFSIRSKCGMIGLSCQAGVCLNRRFRLC